ncbi:hypothetical protein ACTSKR_10310 [Chitinibacteraceae bacterium HSL-7]
MFSMSVRAAWLLACQMLVMGFAFGGAPYSMPWPYPDERLRYHSCGCADACWVAEIIHRGASIARLRCDCQRLYGQWDGPERLLAPSCVQINEAADKAEGIRSAMEELLGR